MGNETETWSEKKLSGEGRRKKVAKLENNRRNWEEKVWSRRRIREVRGERGQ